MTATRVPIRDSVLPENSAVEEHGAVEVAAETARVRHMRL